MTLRQKRITDSFPETKTVEKKKGVRKNLFNVENISQSPPLDSKLQAILQLEEVDVDPFYLAKRALHNSIPDSLPRREAEINEVYQFTVKHLSERTAGSMYISGAPGTGKTSVVTYVLERLSNSNDSESYRFLKLFVNCKGKSKPGFLLDDIAKLLRLRNIDDIGVKECLIKRITSKTAQPIVLILDEMDQLLASASKESLYLLFEWTRIPSSKLILIGIANTLDLTVRHLPKFFSSPKPNISRSNLKKETTPVQNCHSMSFPPYERDDIALILEDRLKGVTTSGNQVFDPAAIKFVAMKVAATTGDMRKALSACKLAIQSLEKENGRSPLKRTADGGLNSSTPKKQCYQNGDKISVAAVAKLLCPQKTEDLPLQQAVILATLLRIHRKAPNTKNFSIDGVLSPIPFDTIYAEHLKICKTGCFSRIESSDIPSYCAQLQDRSLITIVENSLSGGRKKGFGKTNKSSGVIFDPKSAEITLRSDTHLKSVIDC